VSLSAEVAFFLPRNPGQDYGFSRADICAEPEDRQAVGLDESDADRWHQARPRSVVVHRWDRDGLHGQM